MMSVQLCGDGAGSRAQYSEGKHLDRGNKPMERISCVQRIYKKGGDDAQRLGELGRNSDPRG